MTRKKTFWDNPRIKNKYEWLLLFLELIVIAFCAFNLGFTGRIYPHTFVAGINLGGRTQSEAIKILAEKVVLPTKINLTAGSQNFEITPTSIQLLPNYSDSVESAFSLFRTGNIVYDLGQRVRSLFTKSALGLRYFKNEAALDDQISVIAGQVETDPVSPTLTFANNQISVDRGKVGYQLDRNLLKIKIGAAFAFADSTNIEIPLSKVDPTLTEAQATTLRIRGENFLTKTLEIKNENADFIFKGADLLKFIDPQGTYLSDQIVETVSTIAATVNRTPENSVFVFADGRVKEFKPSQDGLSVKNDLLVQRLTGNLKTLEETDQNSVSLSIPVEITPPAIKTSDVNNLGITELIGRGVSYFAGSIPGRVYNVTLAASKFKGVLVPPDSVLSFNDTVGDISAQTGYKPAYVIKDGKTVLGDGGGVCQVSTTLFRAALDAGLPVLERTAHAYRVGYYEQHSPPGLDATVYGPTVDLKIKNNTGNYVLIQTMVDSTNLMLTFEIYGTKDGRVAKTTAPVIANQVAPPPDVYQDDPTAPAGKITQTEHRAWGSTVTFNYTVTKDGQTLTQKKFISNYQPWGNVFLRGTAQ